MCRFHLNLPSLMLCRHAVSVLLASLMIIASQKLLHRRSARKASTELWLAIPPTRAISLRRLCRQEAASITNTCSLSPETPGLGRRGLLARNHSLQLAMVSVRLQEAFMLAVNIGDCLCTTSILGSLPHALVATKILPVQTVASQRATQFDNLTSASCWRSEI